MLFYLPRSKNKHTITTWCVSNFSEIQHLIPLYVCECLSTSWAFKKAQKCKSVTDVTERRTWTRASDAHCIHKP